jgi:DNA-binding CsgD family transcriptional regulator
MMWDPRTAHAIGMIYDTVDPDQGWMPLLMLLTELFSASGGHFSAIDHVYGEFSEHCLYGLDEALLPTYEHFAHTDPRWPIGMNNPLMIINDADHFDNRTYESTEFYNEVLRVADARHGLAVNLQVSPSMSANFDLTRPKSMGCFEAKDVAALELFLPHMLRALQLQYKLRRLEQFADDVVAALDRLPTAALMVSADLTIGCMNGKAERLLAATPTLKVRQGRLTPERASEASVLRKAVSDAQTLASDTPKSLVAPAELVHISRPEKLPLRILAAPLRSRSRLRDNTGHGTRVLLLIYDPEARPSIEPALLESLFKLTSSEAVIAARLAQGRSVAEIAAERRCSEDTVRTHLKALFRKTDTNRQAELVQLILSTQSVSSG